MKISKEILYLSFFLIFLPLFSVATIVYGSNIEHQRWSFDFKDCTVLDALRQITNITNIEIVTNKNGDKEIPESLIRIRLLIRFSGIFFGKRVVP